MGVNILLFVQADQLDVEAGSKEVVVTVAKVVTVAEVVVVAVTVARATDGLVDVLSPCQLI